MSTIEEELEVLQSIYLDDLLVSQLPIKKQIPKTKTKPKTKIKTKTFLKDNKQTYPQKKERTNNKKHNTLINVRLITRIVSGLSFKVHVSLILLPNYPKSLPNSIQLLTNKTSILVLRKDEELELLKLLQEECKRLKGTNMLFSLIVLAQDYLNDLVEQISTSSALSRLPNELLYQIFNKVPHSHFPILARVCQKWREMVVYEKALWKTLSVENDKSALNFFPKSLNQFSASIFGITIGNLSLLNGGKALHTPFPYPSYFFESLFKKQKIMIKQVQRISYYQDSKMTSSINVRSVKASISYLTWVLKHFQNLKRFSWCGFNKVAYSDYQKFLISSDFSKLQTLELSNNHFGRIPETFLKKKSLIKTLNLSGNNISNLSVDFQFLPLLENLILDDNLLKEVPHQIFDLPFLKNLSIVRNQISELILQSNLDILKLEKINLEGNKIMNFKIINNQFALCPDLYYLELKYNLLKKLPKNLVSFTNLIYLGLANNQLVSFPLQAFTKKCKKLRSIKLEDNQITGFQIKDPNLYSNIIDLNISNNKINQIPNWILLNTKIKKLLVLNFSGNYLKKIAHSYNKNQKNSLGNNIQFKCTNLNLSQNQFSKIPKFIHFLPKINTLDLSFNNIIIYCKSNNHIENALINTKYSEIAFHRKEIKLKELAIKKSEKKNLKNQKKNNKLNENLFFNYMNLNSYDEDDEEEDFDEDDDDYEFDQDNNLENILKKKLIQNLYLNNYENNENDENAENVENTEKGNGNENGNGRGGGKDQLIAHKMNFEKINKKIEKIIKGNYNALKKSSNLLKYLSANLIDLNLSNNMIFTFPVELLELRNLKKLNLGGNYLTEIPFIFFQRFQNQLEWLDLSKNKFQIVPFSNGELVETKKNLVGIVPNAFFLLTKLKFLKFKGNPIQKNEYRILKSLFQKIKFK
ncbi:leucine-rich repeat (lrr) family protein [Anaeramoeba flamelloides]|uniref:Leucine-rich repeat (Lrr) family protein n=1 Tax=Anaeramoeba flamelloides TaxID=1746091 RepID=A0ABQ8Z6Y2_9EUKA|nr:leucine-rich repeat (lrr) family protein [Anaeramoeba flamelloides]